MISGIHDTKKRTVRRNVLHFPPRLRSHSSPTHVGEIMVDGLRRFIEEMDAETFVERLELQTSGMLGQAEERYARGEQIGQSFFRQQILESLPAKIANMAHQEDDSLGKSIRALMDEVANKLNQYFIDNIQWDH